MAGLDITGIEVIVRKLGAFGTFYVASDEDRQEHLQRLGDHLAEYIEIGPGTPHVHGCDRTFGLTIGWLQRTRGQWDFMCDLAWLVVQGAQCDCTVLTNIMPKYGLGEYLAG